MRSLLQTAIYSPTFAGGAEDRADDRGEPDGAVPVAPELVPDLDDVPVLEDVPLSDEAPGLEDAIPDDAGDDITDDLNDDVNADVKNVKRVLANPRSYEFWEDTGICVVLMCLSSCISGLVHPPCAAHPLDTNCTAPSLMPTVEGNTVRSFSTHGKQSAAQGSSTTVSRSDIRLIQYLDSSALGLVRRWLLIGYSPTHLLPPAALTLVACAELGRAVRGRDAAGAVPQRRGHQGPAAVGGAAVAGGEQRPLVPSVRVDHELHGQRRTAAVPRPVRPPT